MKKFTISGAVLTGLWVIAFATILTLKWPDALQMGLNEWGDFLAGFMAPLALMWIVIGYFLQGQELRVNTNALKAQQEELRRQVEETALLAKSADRQASAAENAVEQSREESVRLHLAEWSRSRLKLKVAQSINTAQGQSTAVAENIGEPVSHVAIGAALSQVSLKGGAILGSGDKLKLAWPASTPYPVEIILRYRDGLGRSRVSEFSLSQSGEMTEQAETDMEGNPIYR